MSCAITGGDRNEQVIRPVLDSVVAAWGRRKTVAAPVMLGGLRHAGHNVLLVNSGGPISSVVGEVLCTAPEVTIALNMRICNSAVTEFSVSPKRLMLQTFSTLPHLNEIEYASWFTHA